MKIVHIITERQTLKPNADEIEENARKEGKDYYETQKLLYETEKLEEPDYVVEMSSQEFQLISFYLELEKRKPIMNVNVDAELKICVDDIKDEDNENY